VALRLAAYLRQQRALQGRGDEQAMRALLLAIATGQRINEILMMDFAAVAGPGLNASQAAQDRAPAARLRRPPAHWIRIDTDY
jgi:hypothetical protein